MDGDFLELPFFRENGFTLKRCRGCGKPFWSLDPEREYCGDQPCVDYGFIGDPPSTACSTPREVREAFLSFFEERGHKRVGRYPVVARWRDDVFLVGASIYDFQPWVTEGIVDPPANPLVISQPSIRLTDLDNVGRTGRHLTGFEMMAHHAFNVRGARVYWANETVSYAFEVLTRAFRIPPEEISFKFDWWSGGGNAGEDYEVLVRGLEVATLVFMHYRVVDDRPVEMGNRIVDTGYGLERLLWLLTGKPTIYESVFPTLVDRVRREAGLRPLDEGVVRAVAVKSGKLDFSKPLEAEETLSAIAGTLGLTLDELKSMLEPYQLANALVDHTRTLLWMLGDGVVPSNMGSGYLARLLIRRALRYIDRLGLPLTLEDLVSLQMEAWKDDYPEYLELRDEILDILRCEAERFRESVRRGREVAERRLRRLLARGVEEVPLEELVVLYESHGLLPEVVEEEARKLGLQLKNVPGFYSTLAARHERAEPKRAEAPPAQLAEGLGDLAETRRLYYEDARMREFTATVMAVLGNSAVVLDRTAFYPEKGGQLHDTGLLLWEGGSCRVKRVVEAGKIVLHEVEGDPPPPGVTVRGLVDWERRLILMRSHTATHIVLGAARRVLGRHVWQAGAQKGVDQSRLDITHHKAITDEELERIEMMANRVVMEDRRVNIYYMDRGLAEEKYGFVLYQGGVVPEAKLRIVEVEGWDVEACGGLHCSTTGEVGPIIIERAERIQDGVSRLVFKVGEVAVRHARARENLVRDLKSLLNVGDEQIVGKVQELQAAIRSLRRELEGLRESSRAAMVSSLLGQALQAGGFRVVCSKVPVDARELREIAVKLSRSDASLVVALVNADGSYVIKVGEAPLQRGVDALKVNRAVLGLVKGQGGGVEDLVSGKVEDPEGFLEAVRRVLAGWA